MPLSNIFAEFRKSARKHINRHRGSPVVAIRAEPIQPPTFLGPTYSNPYFALGSSTGATLDAVPYLVEPFVPEVIPESGYRSLLPGDGIPSLQNTLASCGRLMTSLSTGDGLLQGRNVILLEQNIVRALHHVRVLRNDARPIGKLPPEVLIGILDLVATPSEDMDSTSAFENLMSFVHVCRYWRTILLNHCAAWSNILVRGQDPNFLTWQIENSQSAPLDVTVHLYQRISNSGDYFRHNFQTCMRTIQEHRNRVKSLSVHLNQHDFFRGLFNFDLPNLEEFAWEDMGPYRPAHRPTAPVWNADRCPNLRRLSVKGTLDFTMEPTTGLTRFKLEGPMIVSLADISNLLERNRTLEHLELVDLHVPAETPGKKKCIGLHNVTVLSFRNVEHGHIFPCISLPALEHLHIGSFDQLTWWTSTVWGNLCIPSGITSLHIKYRSWLRLREGGFDRIYITGFDDTRTHSLNLTEHSLSTRFNPMLSALANTPLHTVTSISFTEEETNDPRYQLLSPPLRTMLGNLPNLKHMDLCWGHLTHQVIGLLQHTCPKLKTLRVKTTRLSCPVTFVSILQLAQARAAAGTRLSKVECVFAGDGDAAAETREMWDTLTRNACLERYLGSSNGHKPLPPWPSADIDEGNLPRSDIREPAQERHW